MDINNHFHTTSFSSVVITILIMDYEALIKRVDQKSASILGTAVASVATLWYPKKAIQKKKRVKDRRVKGYTYTKRTILLSW